MEAGGSPVVLAVYGEEIYAWTQSKHTAASWSPQPQVVIEHEAIISRFLADDDDDLGETEQASLVWFAERSGIVLIQMDDNHFFWLDLQSKQIVRWSSDARTRNKTIYCPCDLGSDL